jgi:hypothetical protein
MRNAKTRTRQIARTASAPEAESALQFLNASPRAATSRELATTSFENAFAAIAKERVQELREEVFQTANETATACVAAHLKELESGLAID